MGQSFEDDQLRIDSGAKIGAVQDGGTAQEKIAPTGDEKSGRESGEIGIKRREDGIVERSGAGVILVAAVIGIWIVEMSPETV